MRSLEDAWPVRTLVLGTALGLSVTACALVVADHVLHRLTDWWR